MTEAEIKNAELEYGEMMSTPVEEPWSWQGRGELKRRSDLRNRISNAKKALAVASITEEDIRYQQKQDELTEKLRQHVKNDEICSFDGVPWKKCTGPYNSRHVRGSAVDFLERHLR